MAKEALKDGGTAEVAEKKNDRTAEAAEKAETAQAVRKEQKPSQESVYFVNELAANAKKLFGTRPECVLAALKAASKTECTVTEAKQIVKDFLKEEVE